MENRPLNRHFEIGDYKAKLVSAVPQFCQEGEGWIKDNVIYVLLMNRFKEAVFREDDEL